MLKKISCSIIYYTFIKYPAKLKLMGVQQFFYFKNQRISCSFTYDSSGNFDFNDEKPDGR